jgi:acyl-coenzyme A synthetase/AMP-(fatty) acid ligase
MKLSQRIEQAFTRYKNKPALSHYASSSSLHTLTYGQLEEQVRELAHFLNKHGMQPHDNIMNYMNKSLGSVVAILAAMLNGGYACSLSSKLKPYQVIKLSALAKPKSIILDRSTINQILKSEDAMGSDNQFILYSETPELVLKESSFRTANAFQQRMRHAPDVMRDNGVFSQHFYGTDRPGYCLFTSGSTGEQKGVLISRDDLVQRVSTEIEDYEITDADCLLSLLPFSFDVGLNQLLASVFSGAHLVILNSWFPNDVIKAIKSLGVTGISAVPTIWADMLSFPRDQKFSENIKTLRYITVSGGDLAPKYLIQLKQYFGKVNIYKTYGQSETFRSGILKPHDYEYKMTSVGQPVKGTRVFILRENDTVAAPDEEGEIIHYGAGTMLRYINDVEGSREKLREIPVSLKSTLTEGRVVFTGDRGKIDREGFLYVLGREDGMIKTMGFRVYPKEIENCLLEYPLVKHAAVVGVPDSRKGQAPIAEVVSENTLDKKELITYLRGRLPYYMVPDDLYIVENLPVTENGKIRYAEIKGKYDKS